MRKRYLIANWKMNLPKGGIQEYLDELSKIEKNDVEIVVAPPFPYFDAVVSHSGNVLGVAGQNCSDHQSGAFTGEVSPAMLRDCGAQYVILGHSERRTIFHENDGLIARKVALAIESGLTPVLCVGEDLKVRDAGHVARHVAEQIKAVVCDALEKATEVIIAYEPIWAIGTGRNASGRICMETVTEIRHALERFWPARYGKGASILYGGSVTPENVDDLVNEGGVDGFLVGGASLDATKFLAIHRGMR
ncbi:MAG TPA: triose-phosphate isomerase [Thermoanaerobaculia bacterium]|jgi:triosephosphate isomerase